MCVCVRVRACVYARARVCMLFIHARTHGRTDGRTDARARARTHTHTRIVSQFANINKQTYYDLQAGDDSEVLHCLYYTVDSVFTTQ